MCAQKKIKQVRSSGDEIFIFFAVLYDRMEYQSSKMQIVLLDLKKSVQSSSNVVNIVNIKLLGAIMCPA